MTTTTWTFAPAGVLGSGSVDVRPYPGVVVAPRRTQCRGPVCPPSALPLTRAFPAATSPVRSLNGSVAVLARTHSRPPSGTSTRIRPERRHHPRDPLPGETAELTAHRSSSRPRNPNPGIRGLSLCLRPPAPTTGRRFPAGRRRRRVRGGAAVMQTVDHPTSHRRPGLPGPAAPPAGRAPRSHPPRCGAPAVPGGGPGAVVRRQPDRLEVAKALCGGCPLRDACLAGALDRAEPWGVWGGEIFERGVVIARKRPRGRPRKVAAA